ncbi:response regulator [Rhodohalobacter sp. 8-1]|uniref:response regulator n=1 Tax=Rhodohalobacter sp. 8-1 TaxID=3131972 RepID=UPI0030EEBE22
MTVKDSRKNILIVEDDGIQQIIMKRLASRLGLNVLGIAASGNEAVRIARSLPQLDLIMMDVRLGDEVDGIEAMKKIRKVSNSVKVIYVTGNTEPETRNRAVQTNYEAFLEKPVTEEQLKHAVSAAFTAA